MADNQEYQEENYQEQSQDRSVQTTSTVRTLDVTCTDSYGNETTFKIDNFYANVTMSEVTTAFNYAINTGHWISRYSYPFTAVKSAKKVTTVKTVEALS